MLIFFKYGLAIFKNNIEDEINNIFKISTACSKNSDTNIQKALGFFFDNGSCAHFKCFSFETINKDLYQAQKVVLNTEFMQNSHFGLRFHLG